MWRWPGFDSRFYHFLPMWPWQDIYPIKMSVFSSVTWGQPSYLRINDDLIRKGITVTAKQPPRGSGNWTCAQAKHGMFRTFTPEPVGTEQNLIQVFAGGWVSDSHSLISNDSNRIKRAMDGRGKAHEAQRPGSLQRGHCHHLHIHVCHCFQERATLQLMCLQSEPPMS